MVKIENANNDPTMNSGFKNLAGALSGVSPKVFPSGSNTYLLCNNFRVATPKSIPIPPAKNAHLKSAGLPVSPTNPHTNGPKAPPTLIPM